jgi:predicted Zn-dependent peptidase
MNISSKVIDNGLKISVCSFPQLQTVGIAFGVKFGSIDEKPRINGSAHFLEHMLFKGTVKRTWKDMSDRLRELGVYDNAFTDHETTVYYMQVYRGYFEEAMDILSDMVKNSTIPEKEFTLERGPIINENLIHYDDPRYMMLDYMPRVLYKKHPARMPVGGDNDRTLKNVERHDLLDIYDRYYTPKNSELAVYGGVSASKALEVASRCFGDFERDYKKPRRSIAREKQEKRELTIARKGIKQTRIGIGFKCREFRKDALEEFVSLLTMERYLDDRLYDEIRQKRGLSYDPMAEYSAYSTYGFFAAVAGIEPKRLNETKSVMLKEFEKLQDGEISLEELNRSKSALQVEQKTARESSLQMSLSMATFELMYGGCRLLESLPGMIAKVSLDDVRKYCNRYIDVDRYGMVLLKPE